MKNPNSKFARLKAFFAQRWVEQVPGVQTKYFSIKNLILDIGIFFFIPSTAALVAVALYAASTSPKKTQQSDRTSSRTEAQTISKSQIVDFERAQGASLGKRAPGSLVRVSLLNVVETYSTAPVHVRVLDQGLGSQFRGGTLIGEATPDPNFNRITITFKFARDAQNTARATGLSARGLSLDGTLGLEAEKREGFGARATIGSAASLGQSASGQKGGDDGRSFLVQALTAGLLQEFNGSAQVEKNRSQVLALAPGTEFFAELTDYFPGGGR